MDKKALIAHYLDLTGLIKTSSLFLNNPLWRGPLLRAVNYHGTPAAFRDQLARQFEYYTRNFNVISEDDLPRFLKGEIKITLPHLLITFDDGFRNNYTVAAKLLDEFKLKAIFFVPVAFIDLSKESPDRQKEFCQKEMQWPLKEDAPAEEYCPMFWEEVKDLVSRGQAIGSHTYSHCCLGGRLDNNVLEQEIVRSRELLEEQLRRKIVSFCWPGGEISDYSKTAYDLVTKHYDFAFTTFAGPLKVGGNPYAIDRSNVEAWMDIARVKVATQGITELYFLSRRKQFAAMIK